MLLFRQTAIVWAWAAIGAWLIGLQASHADARLVSVLRPHAPGLSQTDVVAIDGAVLLALRERQMLPTTTQERDVILANENMELCTANTCMERIARLLHVQMVIHYSVRAASIAEEDARRDWQLGLKLYNATIGGLGGDVTRVCAQCALPEATTQLVKLLDQAITQDEERPRGAWAITSVPSGVSVVLDGAEVGTTPFARPAFAGHHALTLRLGGFVSHHERVIVAPGQTLSRRIVLDIGEDAMVQPLAAPPPTTPPTRTAAQRHRPAWRMAVGGALVGLGIAGIASGAYAFRLDGQCYQTGELPTWVCVQGYTPGVSLTVPGVMLMLLGGGLWAVPGG